MVDHFREGGVQGTEKLHSSECFHDFFFLFPRTLSCFFLFSIYYVDFIIWFLKRWYFFQEKNQAIMNVFLLLENLDIVTKR